MGIKEKTFKIVSCDICEEMLDITGNGGFTIYETVDEAKKDLTNQDWLVKKSQIICPSCQDHMR